MVCCLSGVWTLLAGPLGFPDRPSRLVQNRRVRGSIYIPRVKQECEELRLQIDLPLKPAKQFTHPWNNHESVRQRMTVKSSYQSGGLSTFMGDFKECIVVFFFFFFFVFLLLSAMRSSR